MNEIDQRLACPTCGREVDYRRRAQNPFYPFCSERCKLIDLGRWFDGEHRISEPLLDRPEEADGQGRE